VPSIVRRSSGPRSSNHQPVILMYHRVGAKGADPHRLSVSEATFRAQLAWLRDSCCVVPLEELAGGHSIKSEKPMVVLTFDDGYVDNFTVAAPALRECGLPATFFLTTEESPLPYYYWWDRLSHALLGVERVPETLTLDLPAGRQTFETSTAAQRHQAHALVYNAIVRSPPGARDAVVHDVFSWAGRPALELDDRRMTWTEVEQLVSDGCFTIGAHTVRHAYLPAQSDSTIMAELRGSRETLQTVTGSSVDALAYPFRAHDERIVAAARTAGFRVAVTGEDRTVVAGDRPLALPRVEVIEEPPGRFVVRLERLAHAAT
jgi:peptidoglycan/xylan/chitin deacetylase (PgdA/CDA1 family)